MSDRRKIRSRGQEIGSYGINKLYRMATRGDIEAPVEFWSEAKQRWMPLAGIMFDIEPSRVPEMRDAGITKVAILGSGSDDCPACTAFFNKVFAIDDVPDLPPADCSCVPWCRLTVIARE